MANKEKCPCCGYLTLTERGIYDICQVCFWEDDGIGDLPDGTRRPGSPNRVSLAEGKENFRKIGASEPMFVKNVRPPTPEEKP